MMCLFKQNLHWITRTTPTRRPSFPDDHSDATQISHQIVSRNLSWCWFNRTIIVELKYYPKFGARRGAVPVRSTRYPVGHADRPVVYKTAISSDRWRLQMRARELSDDVDRLSSSLDTRSQHKHGDDDDNDDDNRWRVTNYVWVQLRADGTGAGSRNQRKHGSPLNRFTASTWCAVVSGSTRSAPGERARNRSEADR